MRMGTQFCAGQCLIVSTVLALFIETLDRSRLSFWNTMHRLTSVTFLSLCENDEIMNTVFPCCVHWSVRKWELCLHSEKIGILQWDWAECLSFTKDGLNCIIEESMQPSWVWDRCFRDMGVIFEMTYLRYRAFLNYLSFVLQRINNHCRCYVLLLYLSLTLLTGVFLYLVEAQCTISHYSPLA